MIRVEAVAKRFGRTVALRDVAFSIGRGEVVGFVGPNGAGKTTTLRIITGYLDADRGQVRVAGYDVARERAAAVAQIGYLPESVPLYGDMRVQEYLRFRARAKGIAGSDVGARVDAVTDQLELDDHRRRPIGQLSKGYRQRVGLADALIGRPPILLLDEPTAGLDPVQVRGFRELLAGLARDHTVLLSSHILPEVELVAGRIIVIVGGRIVADGAPDELRAGVELGAETSLEDVFVALAQRAGDKETA